MDITTGREFPFTNPQDDPQLYPEPPPGFWYDLDGRLCAMPSRQHHPKRSFGVAFTPPWPTPEQREASFRRGERPVLPNDPFSWVKPTTPMSELISGPAKVRFRFAGQPVLQPLKPVSAPELRKEPVCTSTTTTTTSTTTSSAKEEETPAQTPKCTGCTCGEHYLILKKQFIK